MLFGTTCNFLGSRSFTTKSGSDCLIVEVLPINDLSVQFFAVPSEYDHVSKLKQGDKVDIIVDFKKYGNQFNGRLLSIIKKGD